MAKPNFPEKQTPPQPAWGTWEELLLASAVNRHGTTSWDSVAAELRKRATATTTSIFLLLTPLSCKQKFLDLRRRFSKNDDGGGGAEEKEPLASISFLDELRRLRVDELRRELQRYDLSIVSLETKVEKLKEEREMSLRGIDDRETKPDLEREEDRNGSLEVSPENKVPGEASAIGERSENESNSSDLKKESPKTEAKESDRSEPAAGEKPPEDSYDGSSDTTAKGSAAVSPVERTEMVEPEELGGDSAESKGGIGRVEEEDGTNEVCSRESLSRKKLDAEPDGEVETKQVHINVESQPLIKFLQILRSHNSGSVFERRLPIQETRNYNNIIRQHIDFETIGTRIDEGRYSNSNAKYFRDLMLVLNNALVFFGRKSPESAAAAELLTFVRTEMKTTSQAKQEAPVKEEEEEEEQQLKPSPPVSLMRKPKISIPMNACRKRSSIALRTVSANTNITSTSSSEEHQETKKESDTTTMTTTLDARAAAKNGRKDGLRGNARNKKNPNTSPSPVPNQDSDSKPEKNEKNVAITGAKKRSAASFLNRLKRGSPAKSKEEETTNTPLPKRRAVASLEESPAKRNVGRPNKRLPAPATKRRRQSAEAEVVVAPRNAKKRLRK